MKYKTRSGIILTEICGEYVLVSASFLKDICPYLTQINESSAFLWEQLKNGATEKDLIDAIFREYDVTDREIVKNSVDLFLKQMEDYHYLLCQEE